MKIVSDLSVTGVPARAVAWTPAWLFRNGERGAWYDPGEPATLWQDTAATLPAIADQPVARIDDLSGNGHHMIQDSASARPVLRAAASGHALEFDGTGTLMHAVSPPSAWAWAHREGGVTIGIAAEVAHRTDTLEFLIGTMSGASSTDTGVVLNSDNRDIVDNPRNARVQIARGIAGQVAASFIVHSGAKTKIWTYVTQAGGLRLTGQDFAVQSGWMNLPASAGDPSLTLFLGGAGGNRLQGFIHAAVVVDRALDAAEEARLRRWLGTRAGGAV
ncbi:MAG: hypothetical protein CMN17_11275 [Roseovarius sp.]|nr:hypothetical protein [Roseovarius sp.]MBK44144.1 hypothetical protein [Roseovarius sp.]|tara:strand:+ start:1492 stop:2313 length:822 start_codon:yes stop_codon:yes gene_type:complete